MAEFQIPYVIGLFGQTPCNNKGDTDQTSYWVQQCSALGSTDHCYNIPFNIFYIISDLNNSCGRMMGTDSQYVVSLDLRFIFIKM